MKNFNGTLVTALVLAGLVQACGAFEPERFPLPVGPALFQVEVARSPEERSRGLMHRTHLPETAGMLFVFDEELRPSFWMKNTLIPLDLAYISRQGIIREILPLQPGNLTPVPSTYLVQYALEVNRGALEGAGVKVGDPVDLSAVPGLIR